MCARVRGVSACKCCTSREAVIYKGQHCGGSMAPWCTCKRACCTCIGRLPRGQGDVDLPTASGQREKIRGRSGVTGGMNEPEIVNGGGCNWTGAGHACAPVPSAEPNFAKA